MAASTPVVPDAVKSCLCGSVQQGGPGTRVRPGGAHKCRICRTKPRFFLRSQRSLDLGTEAPAAPTVPTPPPHAGSPTSAPELPRRRARSAERYDGMRVNGEQQPSLELYFVRAPPRQTSLQSPPSLRGEEEGGRRGDVSSPPPDYSPPSSRLPASMLATPASPPPTYEEAEMTKALSPPSYEESVGQTWVPTPGPAAGLSQLPGPFLQAQQHACSCSKCKASSARSQRAPAAPELRVALPPEAGPAPSTTATHYLRAPGAGALSASSHDQCSCYKCQSRYSSSCGDRLGDNDVLLTLETQTAMQGVLTDGVALCSLV